MREQVRSGRAWVPLEWREALGVRWYRRSAVVAVTGVRNRDEAAHVLAGHLPMVPIESVTDGDVVGHDVADDDGGLSPDGAAAADATHVDDYDGARRIARHLGSVRAGRGTRELLKVRAVNPNKPAVYAWRSARPRSIVFRLYPSGDCVPVAEFIQIQRQTRSGHMRPALSAQRFT